MVLIGGLPEGSALHVARAEGKPWTLSDAISWQSLGQLARLNNYMRAWLKIKPNQDKFTWPATPWEETEKSSTRYGKVAPEDRGDAVDYLLTLYSGEA